MALPSNSQINPQSKATDFVYQSKLTPAERERILGEDPVCPVCGGPICEHQVCINNWCQHDHQCLDCLDQRNLEQDAEDNFRYYSGEKPE